MAISKNQEITQQIQHDRDLVQLMSAREIISSNSNNNNSNNHNSYHSKIIKKNKENTIRMIEIIDFKTVKLRNNSSLQE